MQTLLDTSYHVETPEAIDLTAQLAGPVVRVLAFAIDFAYRVIALIVLMIVLGFTGEAGWGIFLIMWFVAEWFYPVLFEVLRKGQTPGKKSMGIAVVNDDLTPITWSTSLIRNLLRAADIIPFGYTLGLLVMCSTQNFQRLGDLAAGSVVIHRRNETNNDLDTLPDVASHPPPVALSINDQVAFTGFSQRHAQLSEGRKQEIADILKDVTHKEGDSAVKYLQGVGNWLLGNRN